MKRNIIFVIVFILLISTTPAFATYDIGIDDDGLIQVSGDDEASTVWGEIITEYKDFVTGIAAVGAVTMVLLFIKSFIALGASAGNPNARHNAIVGLVVTGVAASLLGGVALFTGIFYNAIR